MLSSRGVDLTQWTRYLGIIYSSIKYILSFTVKEISAGDDEEGTSGQPASKRLKVEPEKKKEKRHKVDEDEIQKMQ